VMLKDYGGIGGLKTVSVRSLGAEHTAVQVDGVKISDNQTGQIDLGRFSLENVERLELFTGNPTGDLHPATAYSSANVINLVTRGQRFSDFTKPIDLRAAFHSGSFGLFGASLRSASRVSENVVLSLNAERLTANGEYDYVLENGFLSIPSRRRNTDISTLRLDADLGLRFSASSTLFVKGYVFNSARGLPGFAVIDLPENSLQRLDNRDAFLQAIFNAELSASWSLRLSGKVSRNFLRYQDPDALRFSLNGINDTFTQLETFLSGAVCYKPLSALSLNVASDVVQTRLNASPYSAMPIRTGVLTSAAIKLAFEKFSAETSLLAALYGETTETGTAAPNRNQLAPTLMLGYKPFTDEGFRLRGFYKQSFRLPTFNDLYYTRFGNRNVRPETVQQINLGAGYEKPSLAFLDYARLQVDVFQSFTTDKLIAVPTRDLFNWSVQNIGTVEATGLDAHLEAITKKVFNTRLSVTANYTFQNVVDKTERDSRTFNNQIAYTPYETASLVSALEYVKDSRTVVALTWTMTYAGYRFQLGENIAANFLPAFLICDAGVSLSQFFFNTNARIKADVNNLFDVRYSIINGFPMPPRHLRFTLSLNY
jgi:vitamin B12 transporter